MVPRTPISCSLVLESTPSAIEGVCKRVLYELEVSSYSQEDIFAIHLALEEAFINAVQHGNKMDPNKKVKVDYSVSLDEVRISMADEGSGFDPNAVPDPTSDENLYKTDGRGLYLVRSYMDVVEFNEQGNCMHMVRYKEKTNRGKKRG